MVPLWASAQSFQERILSSASQAPDLKFPDEATADQVLTWLRSLDQ